jgi:hypothetical protein
MSTPARTRLRNHLLRGGVYVKSWSKNTTLADTLYEAINEETQHEWTNQEILDSLKTVNYKFSSPYIRLQLNANQTGLAIDSATSPAIPTTTPLQIETLSPSALGQRETLEPIENVQQIAQPMPLFENQAAQSTLPFIQPRPQSSNQPAYQSTNLRIDTTYSGL